ncbi:MAG: hypothetical protein JNJ75_18245 [Cyclobacteriaceae bacterium]|nr:hypothetical protein [Cyclobacteriaceae bacterium]
MHIQEKLKVRKTSNFPEQRFLSELELLNLIEQHYNGRPAARIYVAPMCYILPEFYEQALQGMLGSFEAREEYEACARVIKLLANI